MLGCGYKALRCRFALWGMALGIYKRQLYWAGQHMGCDPVRCRWCEWAVSAMHMCGLSRPRAPPSSTSPPVFFPKTYIYETEYAGEGSSHCDARAPRRDGGAQHSWRKLFNNFIQWLIMRAGPLIFFHPTLKPWRQDEILYRCTNIGTREQGEGEGE